ncbi:MAG: hypothetical protein N3D17_01665 [bacterium]|nr:hypothetical protein [bacterium]
MRNIKTKYSITISSTDTDSKERNGLKKLKKIFYYFFLIRHLYRFIKNIIFTTILIYCNNKSLIKKCYNFINKKKNSKEKEVALVGISDTAKIIILLMKRSGIKIKGIYDNVSGLKFLGYYVKHYSELCGYNGAVLVTSSINSYEKFEKLIRSGVHPENIEILNNE